MGYGLDDWMFKSLQGLRIFLFTTVSRLALGPTQPPIQWVPGTLCLWVMPLGSEVDHSPPSSPEVKNAWSYASTPPIHLHCMCSVEAQEGYKLWRSSLCSLLQPPTTSFPLCPNILLLFSTSSKIYYSLHILTFSFLFDRVCVQVNSVFRLLYNSGTEYYFILQKYSEYLQWHLSHSG
jgi:hypothetical protein